MNKKLYIFTLSPIIFVVILLKGCVVSSTQSSVDHAQEFNQEAAQSAETYIQIQNWVKKNPEFPYAGTFIDEQGDLNVRIKSVNKADRQSLTNLFGNELIILDANVALKDLKDVYENMQANSEDLIEQGVPLSGFYIRETENKLYIELSSIDNDSISMINEVIGEHSFIEYVEVGPFVED